MRVKAKIEHGVTYVRILVDHPMETGQRIDTETSELIPAKYIQQLTCEHSGKFVLVAQLGTGVSKNPYLAFSFKGGKKGDLISIRWNDNEGDSLVINETIQ